MNIRNIVIGVVAGLFVAFLIIIAYSVIILQIQVNAIRQQVAQPVKAVVIAPTQTPTATPAATLKKILPAPVRK